MQLIFNAAFLQKKIEISNSEILFKQGFRSVSRPGGNRLCIITIKCVLDVSHKLYDKRLGASLIAFVSSYTAVCR